MMKLRILRLGDYLDYLLGSVYSPEFLRVENLSWLWSVEGMRKKKKRDVRCLALMMEKKTTSQRMQDASKETDSSLESTKENTVLLKPLG